MGIRANVSAFVGKEDIYTALGRLGLAPTPVQSPEHNLVYLGVPVPEWIHNILTELQQDEVDRPGWQRAIELTGLVGLYASHVNNEDDFLSFSSVLRFVAGQPQTLPHTRLLTLLLVSKAQLDKSALTRILRVIAMSGSLEGPLKFAAVIHIYLVDPLLSDTLGRDIREDMAIDPTMAGWLWPSD